MAETWEEPKAKAIFEVRITQRQKRFPLTFSIFVESSGKALALEKAFEGNEDFKVEANLNAARVLFSEVSHAYLFITSELKGD